MSPREDPSPLATRTRRPDRQVSMWPMVWVRAAGVALVVTGLLIVLVSALASPPAAAPGAGQTVGFVATALGIFVVIGLPGALAVVRHPWAAATLQTLERSFKHPRLAGWAQVCSGVLALAWLISESFLVPDRFVPLMWAFGWLFLSPVLAVWLFDRRR